jgi:aspartyl-tRNA(Asn)/glutamyl-tRNA(Gln) amidotransferase subunit A
VRLWELTMATDDLIYMPIKDLATHLQSGNISPVDLVRTFMNQIEKENDNLNVYITVLRDRALTKAKEEENNIRKGNYRGPLHGIPYACKDLFLTRNVRTTGGSQVLEDWVPQISAAVIERIEAAGGILLGKLNQHEFAYGATGENEHYGTVSNPWDTNRLAGGSSSGSAAAVAAGLAAYTLGTDTGGSVRAPAALCGVIGLKPTYGRISTYGVIPYCWSLDHVGIFSQTVEDAAVVLQALAGHDPRDPYSANVPVPIYSEGFHSSFKGLRIGIPRNFFFDKMDTEITAAIHETIQICELHDAELIEVDMPSMDKTRTVSLIIQLPEMLSYHSRYLSEKKHLYGADIRAGMALGQFIMAEHYVRAKRMVERFRRELANSFEKVDVIVTPTCPIVAPKIGSAFIAHKEKKEAVGNAITRFTSFFNMTGNPAISIPCGISSTGLPIGVQFVGRHFDERTLLGAAHVLEQHLNFRQRFHKNKNRFSDRKNGLS